MKKAARRFGHGRMEYRLDAIFNRVVLDFDKADAEAEKLKNGYQRTEDVSLIQPIFLANAQRIEAGVLALFAAGAWLEQMLHEYAVTFIDPDYYEAHFGRLQMLTRWLLVPQLCQGKIIDEQSKEINNLREFIKARNAVVHPKLQIIGPTVDGISTVHRRVDKETTIFFRACRNAEATVYGLRSLLESPAPMPK